MNFFYMRGIKNHMLSDCNLFFYLLKNLSPIHISSLYLLHFFTQSYISLLHHFLIHTHTHILHPFIHSPTHLLQLSKLWTIMSCIYTVQSILITCNKSYSFSQAREVTLTITMALLGHTGGRHSISAHSLRNMMESDTEIQVGPQ